MAERTPVEVEDLVDGLQPLLIETDRANAHLHARLPSHVITRVHGHFEFAAMRYVNQRYVFGLLRDRRSARIADAVIDTELRPTRIPPPLDQPARRRVLPSFLRQRELPETVYIDLVDGTSFAWMLDKPGDRSIEPDHALAICWTLAAWCRHGRKGRQVPLEMFDVTQDRLLYQVLDELDALLDKQARAASNDERPWSIDSLRLKLRARLNESGEVTDPLHRPGDATSHRFAADISLVWERNGLSHALVVNQLPVDTRVSSDELEPFLDEIKKRASVLAVRRRLLEQLTARAPTAAHADELRAAMQPAKVEAFLADSQHQQSAVVMTVGDERLETLIALSGKIDQVPTELILELPRTDDGSTGYWDRTNIEVHVAKVDLDWLRPPATLAPGTSVHTYVMQLCAALGRWQESEPVS